MAVNMTPKTIPVDDWVARLDGSVHGSDPEGTGGAAIPLAPTGFTATYLSDTSLSLAWTDNATNELNYELDRSLTGTGSWTALADPAANATSATSATLTVDTQYFYRLRAVNAAGNSSYATANGTTTAPSDLSAVAFKSFVFETNTDDTTISIVVDRHPDLDMNFAGSAVATVTASDGFNSAGRYTALSSNVSWGVGDVSSKTVSLVIPAQTLDGVFEVNLDLTPVSGCSVRKWEEGAALARVDDGSVCSFGYHIDPSDPAARDELDAGTAVKPALSSYYFWQDIIYRTHPDPNAPFIVYYHNGSYTDSGNIKWSSSRQGHYPEIDGTREHPVKIQNYPGDTVDFTNSVGFLIEDRQHVHFKGFNTGPHNNKTNHWALPTANYLLFEDFIGAGIGAPTGTNNLAAFFLNYTGNTVIRNCHITDVKLDDGNYNHNLAPILSYGAYNVLVESCYFNDAGSAIYQKIPPRAETLGEQAFTIRSNEFGPLLSSSLAFTNGAAWGGGHYDSVLVYNNLMVGGGAGLDEVCESEDLVQDDAIVSTVLPMHFYNNTLVDIDTAFWSGHLVNFYNNAIRASGSRMIQNLRYGSKATANGSIINYSDYNLSDVISATIISTGPVTTDYATKATWNAAVVGERLLTASPDSNSTLQAATFTNEGGGDYTVTNAAAVSSGYAGMPIGADSNVGIV